MPKVAIDYSNTIIYKIVCNDLSITDTYVGHTTNFVKRRTSHKNHCNNEKSTHHHLKIYQTIRNNGGFENWSMLQIEKYPCNDVFEAKARERYWIEELHSKLNITIPNRTNREYKIDNRAVILEKNKIYREKNRDKRNQKLLCACGKVYSHNDRTRHLKSQYHINFVATTEKTPDDIPVEI